MSITVGQHSPPLMNRKSLNSIWYSIVSAMFFIYLGAALALAYGTVNALIGLALTIAVYGVINRVIAEYALRNNLSVAEFSRSILGRSGASIASLILGVTALYYAVFEGSIVAFAFQAEFGGPLPLWSAIVVAYSTPLVVGRVREFLDRVNGFLLPIYWGGLLLAVVWAGFKYGTDSEWITHSVPALPVASGGPGWLAAFAAYIGVWVLMMYTMDFAAMGRSEDARFHKRYTFGYLFYALAFGVNAVVGIFLTFTIPGIAATETGVATGLVQMLGVVGLLIIFVSQTRINTANYHLAITNLQSIGKRVLGISAPMWVWAIVTGAAIYLMMLLPVVQYLLVALSWQAVLITGWVGIAFTHIMMTRRHGESADPAHTPESRFARFYPPGIVAWTVSTAAGLVILQSGVGWGPGIGALVTPILAATIYGSMRTFASKRSALLPALAN